MQNEEIKELQNALKWHMRGTGKSLMNLIDEFKRRPKPSKG